VGERQAKVRPEFGMWYPELSAESGYPATWVREAMLVELCHGQSGSEPQGPMLGYEHLEFRDGQGERGSGQRSRQKDPPASSRRLEHLPDPERPPHA
jgi:hypothetical protein